MAKRSAVNKSQAIRDAMRDNPTMSPKEIAELLSGQGLKVNAQYVSTIKSNTKNKVKRTVVRRKPSAAGKATDSPMAAALGFIRAAGGLSRAKDILQTVEEIAAAAR